MGICFEVVYTLPAIDMIRDPVVIQGAMEAYMTARDSPLASSFHSGATIPIYETLKEPGRSELLALLDQHLKEDKAVDGSLPLPSRASQYASIRTMISDPEQASAVIVMGASQFHFDASTQKEAFAISDRRTICACWSR